MPYFDHAATTSIHPDVLNKIINSLKDSTGNPSSVHTSGRQSKSSIESARRIIAETIDASPNEIFFTGSGTEANNMVLWSAIHFKKKHIITSEIEHPAITKVLEKLSPFGLTFTCLPVNSEGLVNPDDLVSAIKPNTGLISIMMANNEVGSIQPIEELIEISRSSKILFHSDTVQVLGKAPLSVKRIKADYLSFSAHKFYGPKGVGFLYKKTGAPLHSLIIGGSQENNSRAGTENISGIIGMGEAANLVRKNLNSRISHLSELESYFNLQLKEKIPKTIYNGNQKNHIPGLVSLTFPGNKSNALLIGLDRLGIEVSSGSACGSGAIKPSPVLRAMGVIDENNISTLRISFGRENTKEQINELIDALITILK